MGPIDFNKMASQLLKDLSSDIAVTSEQKTFVVKMYLEQAHELGKEVQWWSYQDLDEAWITSHSSEDNVKAQLEKDYEVYKKWKAI